MLRSTDESGMPRIYSRWEKATPRKTENGTISTQMMKLFHALASSGPTHSRTARLCESAEGRGGVRGAIGGKSGAYEVVRCIWMPDCEARL